MTRPAKDRPFERRVWFALMDATRWLPRSTWRDDVYLFAVGKAAECVDWPASDAMDEEVWP